MKKKQSHNSLLSEAADNTKRELLLATLEANDWNLTRTGAALRMGHAGCVWRMTKKLLPKEHEAAKKAGRIRRIYKDTAEPRLPDGWPLLTKRVEP